MVSQNVTWQWDSVYEKKKKKKKKKKRKKKEKEKVGSAPIGRTSNKDDVQTKRQQK
jgi:hypothetical protein